MMEKCNDIGKKVSIGIIWFFIGALVMYIFLSVHITLDKRESYEYANLLKCEQERYEYCPYCGKELEYKYSNPLTQEATQDIIDRWLGE